MLPVSFGGFPGLKSRVLSASHRVTQCAFSTHSPWCYPYGMHYDAHESRARCQGHYIFARTLASLSEPEHLDYCLGNSQKDWAHMCEAGIQSLSWPTVRGRIHTLMGLFGIPVQIQYLPASIVSIYSSSRSPSPIYWCVRKDNYFPPSYWVYTDV